MKIQIGNLAFPLLVLVVTSVQQQLLLLLWKCSGCQGFTLPSNVPKNAKSRMMTMLSSSSRLFGLAEWRQDFAAEGDDETANDDNKVLLLLLPFRMEEALVPGQSVTITLKHGRFLDLFQDVMDSHHMILGMMLMNDDGPTSTVVLIQITDFQVDAGFRGEITLQVALEAVGRAVLDELTAWKPITMGYCREITDHAIDVAADRNNSTNGNDDGIQQLLETIQTTVDALGKRSQFDRLYEAALNVTVSGSSTNDFIVNQSIAQEQQAIGWAALAVANETFKMDILQTALQSMNAMERLQLVKKALLEERLTKTQEETNSAIASASRRMVDGVQDLENTGTFE